MISRCATVVFVTVAFAAPVAADPIYLACRGQTLLANKQVDADAALSIGIDLSDRTVTVDGNQPLTIMPTPGSARSNQVEFFGQTLFSGFIHGNVDRLTGSANITFQVKAPQERFFSGTCRPSEKLF